MTLASLSPTLADREPVVSLRGVGKTFSNGTVALENLDLDVYPGEFLSLLGPSGCGKSTALRLMAGLGRRRGNIGFVFQEPTLMPWATVADNVWLPLRLKGVSRAKADATIRDSLALVGLAAFADAYPRELSGGMKMRVSIARALATKPAILLMDEPFAALDEITRFKLNDDLLRLKAELGCTVVFVTHSVYESVYMSSRIVVMAARPGRVISTIDVDVPMPRSDSFRSTPRYAELCREASAALHGAMAPDDHL
jgi:NitT/TauT family transport system ATP-binding protein